MKTPEQDIDIFKMNQVAHDMLAYAFLLRNMESDPNGTLSLTASILMDWSSSLFEAMGPEGKSN